MKVHKLVLLFLLLSLAFSVRRYTYYDSFDEVYGDYCEVQSECIEDERCSLPYIFEDLIYCSSAYTFIVPFQSAVTGSYFDLNTSIFLGLGKLPTLPSFHPFRAEYEPNEIPDTGILFAFTQIEPFDKKLLVRLVGRSGTQIYCTVNETVLKEESFDETQCLFLGKVEASARYMQDGHLQVNVTVHSSKPSTIVIGIFDSNNWKLLDYWLVQSKSVKWKSRRAFNYTEMKRVKVVVIAYYYDETQRKYYAGSALIPKIDFAYFKAEVVKKDVIYPGATAEVKLKITNVGTIGDTYAIKVSVPEGWEYTAPEYIPTLLPGASSEFEITLNVPKSFVGNAQINVTVASENGGFSKTLEIFLPVRKEVSIEFTLNEPRKLVSHSQNTLDITAIAYGTVNPTVVYGIYTTPTIIIRGAFGKKKIEVRKIEHIRTNFSISHACALRDEDSSSVEGAVRALVWFKAIYFLLDQEKPSNYTAELINITIEKISDERLKIVSDKLSSVLSGVERGIDILEGLKDAILYGEGSISSYKDALYLLIYGLEQELSNTMEELSKECKMVDSVTFNVFLVSSETAQSWVISEDLPITGKKPFELIGPLNLTAIAGETYELTYTIKSNVDEDYELYPDCDIDWVRLTPFVHLPAKGSIRISARIRPPSYLRGVEKGEILLDAGPFKVSYPITIYVGRLEPELSVPGRISIEPGKTSEVNVTIRNKAGSLPVKFEIEVEGEGWVSYPNFVWLEGDRATFTLRFSPPKDTPEGSYVFRIRANAEGFEGLGAYDKIVVFVSRQAQILLGRLKILEERVERLREKGKDTSEVEDYIASAKLYLDSGSYSKAQIYIKKAERALEKLEKGGGSINIGMILGIVIVLAGAGFLAYKFLVK